VHSSVSDIAIPARIGADDALTIRRPSSGRLNAREVLTYWPLVRALAGRDLKARYKQSFLGPAWVVFQPVALLGAFSVGFRSVAKIETAGVPYFLFALTGLAVWTYFQATLMVATNSIVNGYALVRYTACPRLALPLATIISNLPSLAVTGVAAVVAAAIGGYLGWAALLVPLLTVWLLLLAGAYAVLLAGLTVRARDVVSVMPFLLQITLFLSPVAYRTSQLPGTLQSLIAINPLSGLIDAWRWALLGLNPNMTAVGASLALTLLLLVAAWRVFNAIEVVMSDEI
jgi:lipopolysaccharide transport system permease protein